ncbi:MAG: ABC transporter substrate-binding protein [Clostridia bacterium]|nr:ABC transporter substrate-binding protein [Clostridia bacterium]
MKKLLACLLVAVMLFSLIACGGGTPAEIRIAGMKGPTTMGLVKLMDDSKNGLSYNTYDFSLKGKANEITPLLIKGELDMAALPANVAATLYKNTNGAIEVLAINTLGVLNIVTKGVEINSLEDLKGKTVYATGKGTTPEYSIRYLLTQNGIDPAEVNFEWTNEASEVGTRFSTSDEIVALLPQPYVTSVLVQNPTAKIALDLSDEWDALENGSSLVTGVLVARKEFVDANPHAVAKFLEEYEASVAYCNENLDGAAELIVNAGILGAAPVAKRAIPHCHVTFIAGNAMKTKLKGYLEALYAQDPTSVGGALPSDDFYYTK